MNDDKVVSFLYFFLNREQVSVMFYWHWVGMMQSGNKENKVIAKIPCIIVQVECIFVICFIWAHSV